MRLHPSSPPRALQALARPAVKWARWGGRGPALPRPRAAAADVGLVAVGAGPRQEGEEVVLADVASSGPRAPNPARMTRS
jgi:hypothetical protein